MHSLSDPVRYLKGVGPAMAGRLARLGIHTVGNVLFHVPTGHRDRRDFTSIADLQPGVEATIVATVVSKRVDRRRGGRAVLCASLRDESGFTRAVWFNQAFRGPQLVEGERYVFSGKGQPFRGVELHNPEFEPYENESERVHTSRLVPRYGLTEGITERWLRARVRDALDELAPVPDLLLTFSRARDHAALAGLPRLQDAFERLHFPESLDQVEPARRRLALEELLRLQIALQLARVEHRANRRARPLGEGADLMRRFLASLPIALTRSQREAIAAIEQDLDQEAAMRRLLLGDVGSGKTVVALAGAARAAGAGVQTALLAPTAILAEQHARTAERLLAGSGIRHALLTASTPQSERERIRAELDSGALSLVIGTHALLEKEVAFPALGFVVVDEQHRFGVRQRIALAEKGVGASGAHLLVLSATPIPRTLAMAVYGDLDLSPLTEKPPGRTPVETTIVSGEDRRGLLDRIVREVEEGGRAFVVYPLVEESEVVDLKDAVSKAAALARVPALAAAGVALVHGRLKPDERRAAIERFREGEARVLVATTVVEVGLDIPDATLVVIEHPERFGLAQLHQLRGRVGRADRPGRCVLALSKDAGALARKRVGVFQRVTDGFRLAEEDLRLRGPGELLGTAQHGFPELRVADPVGDSDLMEAARDLGAELLERGERERGRDERLREWVEAHVAGASHLLAGG
jgi:ATP-dependent DNA helicase RecG